MAKGLRIFISHSSAEAALALALRDLLLNEEGVEDVVVDRLELLAGSDYERQIHRMMMACNFAIVLVTKGVLAKDDWVRKEATVFAFRKTLEERFSLVYVNAPDVDETKVVAIFESAGYKGLQRVLEPLATQEGLPSLVEKLRPLFPAAPPDAPLSMLQGNLAKLLRATDPGGAELALIAEGYGITPALMDDLRLAAQLADKLAAKLVEQRLDSGAYRDFVQSQSSAWTREHLNKFVGLMAPCWIDACAAHSLVAHVGPRTAKPSEAPEALTIAGEHVPAFTAEMTVRRAYESHPGTFRVVPVMTLGDSDLFAEVRHAVCAFFALELPPLTSDDYIVQMLRKRPERLFVLLQVLPDEDTLRRLRSDFPRAVFLAPAPLDSVAYARPLEPAPDRALEQFEYESWCEARTAITNTSG